jgi:ADP-heptose:LPS heptosyltransferase
LLIDLSNSAQYGLIEKYFLNIPQRIGFNYKKRGRYLTGTLKLRGFSEKHVVAYYLSLLELINIKPVQKQLKFPLRQDTLNAIAKYLISKGIETDSLLITIVPAGGASWSDKAGYKQWPPEKYAQLADQLISGLNAKIIIAGAEADEEICQSVKKKMKLSQAITVNSFNILEFAGLCNLSNLVICNDGGPLHVAVSQGTPTVSIFGPVDERIYGPYPPDPKHAVVTKEIKCRPCYRNFKFTECQTKDCLQLIMSDEVYAKAKSVLTRYKAGLT